MTYTNILLGTSMPMPITQKAIETANKFAAQQPTPEKREQVYLNTLAILAVQDYLQLMEIDTDLADSDSWNPVVRLCADVADLNLPGLGKLECRPVRAFYSDEKLSLSALAPCSNICSVPPEVWCERIGYVVVQIDEERKEANLLGFAKTAGMGELYFNQLESLDSLLEYLEKLTPSPVNLGEWLTNVFETSWQAIEDIFAAERLVFRDATAFRKGGRNSLFADAEIVRAKLINLGIQLGNKPIALVMAVSQERDSKINILAQLHPAGCDRFLPTHIKLVLLSESGESLQEVQSRGMDLWIQLRQFRVQPGTNFSLQVILDDISIMEAFTI